MPLAPGKDAPLGERPDRAEIVLATGDEIPAVWTPTDTSQPAVVGGEHIQQLLPRQIQDPQTTILRHDRQMLSIRGKRKVRHRTASHRVEAHRIRFLVRGGYGLVNPKGLWRAGDGGRRREEKGGVFFLFVVDDEGAVVVGGDEEAFGAGEPADGGDGGGVDDAVFVDARIFVGDGLEPDYVAGGEADDEVDVGAAAGELVDVVAGRVRFCEEDFGEGFVLSDVSSTLGFPAYLLDGLPSSRIPSLAS